MITLTEQVVAANGIGSDSKIFEGQLRVIIEGVREGFERGGRRRLSEQTAKRGS